MPLQRRKVQVAVVSDLHLGMRGCHAETILAYLKSIDPEVLILNGDIIDIWQFKKKYFPPAHMQVVRELLSMIARGKKVYYITGNHDELFRRFIGFKVGNFELANKAENALEFVRVGSTSVILRQPIDMFHLQLLQNRVDGFNPKALLDRHSRNVPHPVGRVRPQIRTTTGPCGPHRWNYIRN